MVLLCAAFVAYPLGMYCLGLSLRSAASSPLLSSAVPFRRRIALFVCADLLSLLVFRVGGLELVERYILPMLERMQARAGFAICDGPRVCVLYWFIYGVSDLIGVTSVLLLHRVLVKLRRLEPAGRTAVLTFFGTYVAVAFAILVSHYLVYPVIDSAIRSMDPFPPRPR